MSDKDKTRKRVKIVVPENIDIEIVPVQKDEDNKKTEDKGKKILLG